MLAIVTGEMVGRYGASYYMRDETCYFIYVIRYLIILVNVISIIIMEYPTSYSEVCYPVNRLGIHFCALYTELLTTT